MKADEPPKLKLVRNNARTLAEISARIDRHYASAQKFGRLAVAEAWQAGGWLAEAKALVSHGGWLDYLSQRGIARRTASRFMQLHTRYQMGQLGPFDSVAAALRPVKKTPERRPVDVVRESTARWLGARASLLSRGDELRAELDAGPGLREAALIWCQARALVAEALAEDARLAAELAQARLGTD